MAFAKLDLDFEYRHSQTLTGVKPVDLWVV